MAGTKRGMPYERTGPFPIDDTFVLSKEEMLAVDDTKMPDVYFAACKDDGKMYTYDKSATASAETGKFSVVEGGSGDTEHRELTQAQYDALTPEEKNNGTVYFITDGQTDGYHHYTQTERQIGTWGGRPLYEKLLSGSTKTVMGEDKTLSLGVSTDWTLVNVFGYLYENSNSDNRFLVPDSKSTINCDNSGGFWTLTRPDFPVGSYIVYRLALQYVKV